MTSILAPANVLQVYKGVTKTVQLTVVDTNGDPFDLTGWEVWFTVKLFPCADEAVLIQKRSSVLGQAVLTDAKAGVVEIYLKPADTEPLCPRDYTYDVWITKMPDKYLVVYPSTFQVLCAVASLP